MPFHFLELIFPLLIVFCVVIALIITIARLRRGQEHRQQSENMFQTYQHGYQQLRQPFSKVPGEPGNHHVLSQYDQPLVEYPQMQHPEERPRL